MAGKNAATEMFKFYYAIGTSARAVESGEPQVNAAAAEWVTDIYLTKGGLGQRYCSTYEWMFADGKYTLRKGHMPKVHAARNTGALLITHIDLPVYPVSHSPERPIRAFASATACPRSF